MRTVAEARRHIQTMMRNGETFRFGMCKKQCRQAYAIPTDGSVDAKEAYRRTDHRFTGMWIPGAFAWWRNDGHWHVAICAFRKGYVFSTDLPKAGQWGRIPLTDVHRYWPGTTFVGFSRDIDGKTPVKVPRIVRRYP